ncbi:MAG: hypothetical protein WA951_10015, partial [Leeuwenhoekiella sp.]
IATIFLCLILDAYVLDIISIGIGLILCLTISLFISKRVKKFKSTRKAMEIKKRRRKTSINL